MRYAPAIALLLAAVCAEEEAAPPAAPAAALSEPAPRQTPEQRAAEASAVKRVMLHRSIRMRADRHRYTRENAEASAALAAELRAPAALVELLRAEAAAPLRGNAFYEHRRALHRLLQEYGVDELGILLFAEGVNFPLQEVQQAAEALPMEPLFNLLPQRASTPEELAQQVDILAAAYAQMVPVYSRISSREQADAAAAELLPLLSACDAALPLRMVVSVRGATPAHLLYQRKVAPHRRELVEHRRRLREAMFYGSALLAALDYLLN